MKRHYLGMGTVPQQVKSPLRLPHHLSMCQFKPVLTTLLLIQLPVRLYPGKQQVTDQLPEP